MTAKVVEAEEQVRVAQVSLMACRHKVHRPTNSWPSCGRSPRNGPATTSRQCLSHGKAGISSKLEPAGSLNWSESTTMCTCLRTAFAAAGGVQLFRGLRLLVLKNVFATLQQSSSGGTGSGSKACCSGESQVEACIR